MCLKVNRLLTGAPGIAPKFQTRSAHRERAQTPNSPLGDLIEGPFFWIANGLCGCGESPLSALSVDLLFDDVWPYGFEKLLAAPYEKARVSRIKVLNKNGINKMFV